MRSDALDGSIEALDAGDEGGRLAIDAPLNCDSQTPDVADDLPGLNRRWRA